MLFRETTAPGVVQFFGGRMFEDRPEITRDAKKDKQRHQHEFMRTPSCCIVKSRFHVALFFDKITANGTGLKRKVMKRPKNVINYYG